MKDPEDAEAVGALNALFERRARRLQKPRVSKCPLTNKWIMCPQGWVHHCTPSYKEEVAFRYWEDAIAEGNRVHQERYERLEDLMFRLVGREPGQ